MLERISHYESETLLNVVMSRQSLHARCAAERQGALRFDRLGRLKGFFSPQIAEAIVSGGAEELLKPHRREIAVVFLDLRGFTGFTESSEPEEVMGVLAEYHNLAGGLVTGHQGTVEHFAGDGMMIFFNDPVPLDDAPAQSARMALALNQRFVGLSVPDIA